MKKLLFICLIFPTVFLSISYGQKKISIELSANANLPVTNDITKIRDHADLYDPNILYWKRKKNTNPFTSLLLNAKYPVAKKLLMGLQAGVQFHFNETHFIGIERTFVTIPIQATIDYSIISFKNNALGIFIAAGGVFYKIDDYVYSIKNGFIFNGALFYELNKKHKIKFGLEKQIDNASFNYSINNQSSSELFDFPLNRISLFIGYIYKIR